MELTLWHVIGIQLVEVSIVIFKNVEHFVVFVELVKNTAGDEMDG